MPTYSPENLARGQRETNRVIRYALSLDPADIIRGTLETNNDPNPATVVTKQVGFMMDSYQMARPQETLLEDTSKIIINGVADVHTITRNIIQAHPSHMTVDQLIRIAKHPQTIDSIARLAAHPARQSAVYVDIPQFYSLTPGGSLEVFDPAATPNLRTFCPAVMKNGELSPSPLFSDFIPWATELAARSILLNRIPLPAESEIEAVA